MKLRRFRQIAANTWNASNLRRIVSYATMPAPNIAEKRHGGNIVADVLKANDVNSIFVLSGGHVSPIFVGCEELGIRVIDTRNESNAVFAADANARLTGNIGVAVVTAGPGVTNTVTALKNAQMAGSPVLVLGGAAATLLKGRGALQDIEQLDVLRTVCKETFTVSTVRDIIPTLDKAIETAVSGNPGPVFVELPIDTLYPMEMTQGELNPPAGNDAGSKIVKFFLNAYIHNLFARAFESTATKIVPKSLPISEGAVEHAKSLLLAAKRPVFLLQSQAVLQPGKLQTLAKVLEQAGAPVYLGGMARGLLGGESSVQCRHARGKALKEADVIFMCGVPADFRLNYGRNLPKSAKIVTINRDPAALKQNTDLFWKPKMAVNADPADFMIELLEKTSFDFSPEWLATCKERDSNRDDEIAEKAASPASDGINPVHLFRELDSTLPEDCILIADGGDFVGTGSYILRPRSPLSWLDPGAYGTLGVGGGFALGAAAAFPDRPVLIIYGDGSCGYSLIEMDTAKRLGFDNIHCVIGNDGRWNQILRAQEQILGSPVANILDRSEYEKIAHAFGAEGIKIGPEDEDLAATFSEILTSGKPTVVNALLGSTDFRDGSISV